ncbi:DNA-directed RNA polymerases I, II, and III subunit RPABC3 [Apophysomyces ossiformis]|uniref:DNA-directed RNA polymerases I, II, and III subunit RPABC3 n=1 Tax=Apophysomyces ossiformis TaxID=679940 RepID=A0A8H7EKK6_9FUNG|nr:DNA-directed RNA polymerases I, II, and III subunit RPABC3 [Apophysomyces ossiformis]
MSQDNILFTDLFEIKDIDPKGKYFDRVSRLIARSENYEMDLVLDINSELYPLEVADKFSLVLASSLSVDGTSGSGSNAAAAEKKKESWRERAPGERDLSDEYEYVMHGKVYRYEDASGTGVSTATAGQRVTVYVSYGGLLMSLEGDYRHLQNITVGENLYLLMRK